MINYNKNKIVQIGRISAGVFVLISLIWLPMISDGDDPLFIYVQSVGTIFWIPLSVMYFFAHFWNRANVAGAYCTLIVGCGAGVIRFIIAFASPDFCDEFILCSMHFLYFGIILSVVTILCMIITSLLTKPPSKQQLDGNTYWNRFEEKGNTDKIRIDSIIESEEENESTIEMGISKKHTKPKSQNQLTPLIDDKSIHSAHSDGNIKCKDKWCCRQFINFILLRDDKWNPKWKIIANILTVISLGTLIAVWILFR